MPGEDSRSGFVYLGDKYSHLELEPGTAHGHLEPAFSLDPWSPAPRRTTLGAGTGTGAVAGSTRWMGPLPPPPASAGPSMPATTLGLLRRTRARNIGQPLPPPRPPTTTYADTYTGGGPPLLPDVMSVSTSSPVSGLGSRAASSSSSSSSARDALSAHTRRSRDLDISNRAPHTYSLRVMREVEAAAHPPDPTHALPPRGYPAMASTDYAPSPGESLSARSYRSSSSSSSSSSSPFSLSAPVPLVGIPSVSVVRLETNYPTAPQHTGLDPDDRNRPHMPRSQAWSSGPTFRFFKRYSSPVVTRGIGGYEPSPTGDTYYRPASIEAERRLGRVRQRKLNSKPRRTGEW